MIAKTKPPPCSREEFGPVAGGIQALSDDDLLDVARETNLRVFLHGVNASTAKQLLRRYVDALAMKAAP